MSLDLLLSESSRSIQRLMLRLAEATLAGTSSSRASAMDDVKAGVLDVLVKADMEGRRSLLAEVGMEERVSRRELERQYDRWANDVVQRIDVNLSRRLVRVESDGLDAALEEAADYIAAYADTVHDTNITTAYNAGRFSQATEPYFSSAFPAFELVTKRDERVRKNHRPADGLIASIHDHVWHTYAPPLGYRCRCRVRPVAMMEAKRRGLVSKYGSIYAYYPPGFRNAYPDPGFGDRPDRKLLEGVA